MTTVTFSPLPWSYSKLSRYEECGFRAAMEYPGPGVPRAPFKQNAAAERGNRIHTALEAYLKGATGGPPREAESFSPHLRELVTLGATAEQPWWFEPFGESWKRTTKAKRWATMKLDASVVQTSVARVVDFKTGKVYDSHEDQGVVYAAGSLHRFPAVQKVKVEFWYLDQARLREFDVKRKELPAITQSLDRRVMRMASEPDLRPKPNRFCGWCPWRKEAGGPCPAA